MALADGTFRIGEPGTTMVRVQVSGKHHWQTNYNWVSINGALTSFFFLFFDERNDRVLFLSSKNKKKKDANEPLVSIHILKLDDRMLLK